MRIPEIDEPVVLDGPFWTTLCLAEAGFCWFFKPWAWDYPLWYRIAGAALFPFLAAIVVHSTTMFLVSIAHNFRSQSQRRALFVFAIVVSSAVIAFAWVESSFRVVPDSTAFVAGLLANGLFAYLNRKRRFVGNSESVTKREISS
jgi:hypothetical protein